MFRRQNSGDQICSSNNQVEAKFSESCQRELVHCGKFSNKNAVNNSRVRDINILIPLTVLRCSHDVHRRGLVNNLCISIRCRFVDLRYDVRSSLKERSGQWQSTG